VQQMSYEEHLTLYGRVDIALDSFPYCGTTTTCEALWMGAPVVTLSGRTHVSRVGASILTHAGLAELIAGDREGYIALAVKLAVERERVAELRKGMRERMAGSGLCDEKGFVERVEGAYRGM
jgi:protein O-GlcNAc transferase